VPFRIEGEVETHWLAETYSLPPSLSDRNALAQSIAQQWKIIEPVTLYQAKMLDGRIRYQVAKEEGIPCWAIHFERTEDRLAYVIFPACSGDVTRQISRGQEHQVLILEPAAEGRGGLEVLQPLIDLLAPPAPPIPEQVMTRQARGVAHQVSRCHLAGRVRVVEAEVGEVVTDRLFPVELALVDQETLGEVMTLAWKNIEEQPARKSTSRRPAARRRSGR
jgi:hypothetical protein